MLLPIRKKTLLIGYKSTSPLASKITLDLHIKMLFQSAFIFLISVLLKEVRTTPIKNTEILDAFEEEIQKLRTESWNISHGQPDMSVGECKKDV